MLEMLRSRMMATADTSGSSALQVMTLRWQKSRTGRKNWFSSAMGGIRGSLGMNGNYTHGTRAAIARDQPCHGEFAPPAALESRCVAGGSTVWGLSGFRPRVG
ncbi:hypothetical protein [Thauera humireducens]|uniref:hypothetical protein n=1 Tax=Thauera humireducens TaxID=1134435 RepID=UPI00311D5F9C